MTRCSTAKPVVLLVDDDHKILSLGQEILEHLGYQVLTAGDGDAALAHFTRQEPAIDLVIMDYLLPQRDGYEVLNDLRRLNPEIRVIMASGFFGQTEIDKLRAAGAAGVIHKPFRMRALEDEIHRVLEEL